MFKFRKTFSNYKKCAGSFRKCGCTFWNFKNCAGTFSKCAGTLENCAGTFVPTTRKVGVSKERIEYEKPFSRKELVSWKAHYQSISREKVNMKSRTSYCENWFMKWWGEWLGDMLGDWGTTDLGCSSLSESQSASLSVSAECTPVPTYPPIARGPQPCTCSRQSAGSNVQTWRESVQLRHELRGAGYHPAVRFCARLRHLACSSVRDANLWRFTHDDLQMILTKFDNSTEFSIKSKAWELTRCSLLL